MEPTQLTPLVVCVSGYKGEGKLQCSGLIIAPEGYIITTNANQLVQAQVITITGENGDVYQAKLIHFDKSSDLALLKTKAASFIIPSIGDANNIRIGEEVFVIECFSGIETTIKKGTITSLPNPSAQIPLIQTNVAFSAESSGSPLFNQAGRLLGIISSNQQWQAAQAVPVSEVRKLLAKVNELQNK